MRKIAAGVAAAASLALVAGATAPAMAAGNNSLAAVLTSDGNTFDNNWNDYDIVTEAALAVLGAKPTSAVGVLTKGDVAVTAFIPSDKAFRYLVKDLTGKSPSTERKAFEAVAGLGIDTVEKVLLYHVVAGATIDASAALRSDNAILVSAEGNGIRVNVKKVDGKKQIRLQDQDGNSRNARVNKVDINSGNMQIAHGIDRVLRPLDLPPADN